MKSPPPLGERSRIPKEMMESIRQINEHLVECFVDGLCHVCGTRFPGKWPQAKEYWDLKDWIFYDDDPEAQPPALVCPKCEKEEDDAICIIFPEMS